jgi:hypothetical protein
MQARLAGIAREPTMSIPAFEDSSRKVCRPRRVQRRVYDVPSAQESCVLVRRVVADLLATRVRLTHEECQLRGPADVASPSEKINRRRRLDRIAALRSEVSELTAELEQIGVKLLNSGTGLVGFPTIVNGALAYLLYRHEDDALRFWRYRDERKQRPIPTSWFAEALAHPLAEGLPVP